MRTRVRVLGGSDMEQAMGLLTANPIENLFVLARVSAHGLDRLRLGCDVYGYEVDGELVALCHAGSNIVPVGVNAAIAEQFAHRLGGIRASSSIMGRADEVRLMWEALIRQGGSWRRSREIRAHQPLMLIDGAPLIAGDPRVEVVTMRHVDAYYEAAVAMYTEEVGTSPVEPSGSYRRYVVDLIRRQRAFGIIEDDRVLFKADVGAAFGPYCQIQGVWLAEELRGQGVSKPAMAAVVDLVRPTFPWQSLYVNDFNTRARRLYEAVGFRPIGEYATVLY
ncbi:GNAT family N-acetyltransferase [Propionibacteriaceae bacterium G1746]